MVDRSGAERLLNKALASEHVTFRQGQWQAIDALVNENRRVLVVQATGWGKSIVYFLATRILRDRGAGPTLIISPLLALMRNQILAAERLGLEAGTVNSTLNDFERGRLKDRVRSGAVDALLISPEQLANDVFVQDFLLPIANHIGLLVVDEVHCISDWGHDFRPDYRRLVHVLRQMPDNMPIIGTTATANDRVIKDIRDQLGDIEVHRGKLMRRTLALQTMRLPSRAERLAWLVDHIHELPGTGIVYTLTTRDAEQVADWLRRNGVDARAYHGHVRGEGFGNSDEYRRYLEDGLLQNNIKVLVATTALGMGYDKPDLGFVVHFQAPSSVIAYYQQVGRAGRGNQFDDDHAAIGVLMSGSEDDRIHEYFRGSAFPREDSMRDVLRYLDDRDQGASEWDLEQALNIEADQIRRVLKFLSVESPSPVMRDGRLWRRMPVHYQMDQERIRRLNEQREEEWREVQGYIDERGCLMKFLAEALNDSEPSACGKCASCLGGPVIDSSRSSASTRAAVGFLRRSEFPLRCRKRIRPGDLGEYDLKGYIPRGHQAEEGRVLSRWGDAGWGRAVMEDKQGNDVFRDGLIDAARDMIQNRWQPNPFPRWVTHIPSRRNPNLVRDFAERLAGRLGLPHLPVVVKVKDNLPQKEQRNASHQCRNLDGVFDIRGEVRQGAVLLVDDVVDSAWTLTIAAMLLRRRGSGPVFPFALTSSRAR